jgi:hypothetical protein
MLLGPRFPHIQVLQAVIASLAKCGCEFRAGSALPAPSRTQVSLMVWYVNGLTEPTF